MKPQEALEIVDALYTQVDQGQEQAFKDALAARFGLTATNGAAQTPEAPSESDVWHRLSPAEKEWSEGMVGAMTKHFEKNFPGQAMAFEPLIVKHEDGSESLAIVDVAYKGLDLGNPQKTTWDAARNWDKTLKDKRLSTDINGERVDTRDGVTAELLRELAKHNPNVYEWVWRTGEKHLAGRGRAPVAHVDDGEVRQRQRRRDYDFAGVRFRPAVVKKR